MRKNEFFHLNSKRLIYRIFIFILLWPHPRMAKTIFYGVGNDGCFTDVIGIETALSGAIRLDAFSSYTYSLINGLANWSADSDSDGTLWASEWFQYSYDFTIDSLGVQHPVYYGEDLMIASQTPAPVPIPGTVFLLGSGLLSLLIRRSPENEK